MAAPEALIAAHRAQQDRLSAATTGFVKQLFADMFDVKALTPSWQQLEPLLVALVQQRRQISAGLASNFVAAFRASLGVSGRYVPDVPGVALADDIVPWLRAAGPSTAIDLFNAGRAAEVASLTLDSVNGSVVRMVLDGGRDVAASTAERDPKCVGYQRHASGACCAFCAMLTTRVYRSKATAGEGADWHTDCNCTVVPVYRDSQPQPDNTTRYRDLWNESTRGLSGNDARLAFRRAIEGR